MRWLKSERRAADACRRRGDESPVGNSRVESRGEINMAVFVGLHIDFAQIRAALTETGDGRGRVAEELHDGGDKRPGFEMASDRELPGDIQGRCKNRVIQRIVDAVQIACGVVDILAIVGA